MIEMEQAITRQDGTAAGQDLVATTRQGIAERLADPYLTDHDRWVLRQFARFLGGVAPEPDPRVVPVRAARPLQPRPRWTTVGDGPHREGTP
jgi:hypothetical protein